MILAIPEVAYTYNASVIRVVDGDTAELDVDLGFDVHFRISVRFKGYNAPEMRGPNKADGQLAKDELTQLLTGHSIIIKADKLHSQSFARYLATVFVGATDGWISVADHMIGKGFNVPQGD